MNSRWWGAEFMGYSHRQAPGLERVAPRLSHARRSPGRIPHHVHAHLAHAFLLQQALADVVKDELGRGAAHGGEGEVDVDNAVALGDAVDHAEVDAVHRHLGVLDLGQRGPEALGPAQFPFLCVLRNLWNSSWNIATISALRGPRARHRTSTSSHVMGLPKSQRFSSASNSHGNG